MFPFAILSRACRPLLTLALALSLGLAFTAPANAAAPTISGTPKTTAVIGKIYYFKPTAADADGGTLRFTITGKPRWLSFSKGNGSLWGKPSASDVGTYSNVTISVSDGTSTTRLAPFSIAVSATSNRAPTLSGTPATQATAGQPYAWRPTASDADGDTLQFSVANKPAWAAFDTTDGTLHGTPASANVGSFPDIVIRASDGKATTSLAAFTITVTNATSGAVTLHWTPPTRNVDGSTLTNLAGYTVFYGTGSHSYETSVPVTCPSTSVVIDGLEPGTWYFSIKSRTSSGTESDYSSEVSAAI